MTARPAVPLAVPVPARLIPLLAQRGPVIDVIIGILERTLDETPAVHRTARPPLPFCAHDG